MSGLDWFLIGTIYFAGLISGWLLGRLSKKS